jgi:type VI secretion system secreted protein VgrG
MYSDVDPRKFPLRLESANKKHKLWPIAARVTEAINGVPAISVEFYCEQKKLPLEDVVGKALHLIANDDERAKDRCFQGTCISAEFVCSLEEGALFSAEIRGWNWFLSRRTGVRIFQNMSTLDILKLVLKEHGFSGNLVNRTKSRYNPREYCTQYRETDLDFLNRLLEQEGIYYYFKHGADTEQMVLADSVSGHDDIEAPSVLQFVPYGQQSSSRFKGPWVFEWKLKDQVQSNKVSLDDFDFLAPDASLANASEQSGGYSSSADLELYDFPGRFRDGDEGDRIARIRNECGIAQRKTVRGVSDAASIGTGRTFSISDGERPGDPQNVMVISTVHHIRQAGINGGDGALEKLGSARRLGLNDVEEMAHLVEFETVPADLQYRSPQVTQWPKVSGIHTAIVTGPKGEEIHTDKYGRIRVQFHWDRDPAGNDAQETSCWVRTMMPWTGKNWGTIAVPRIGQEVVIQFEEGDPDRPLCIGMLYNANSEPPYPLPANKTQSGVKTNSSLKGGGFNELMFEDKAGSELVRFQSERDYRQIIKNNAEITVGLEHKDKGDMDLVVHRHLTEKLNTGNHTFTVSEGNQTVKIKKNFTETVEGKETRTVTGNMTETVKQGNVTTSVKMGNMSTKLDLGNYSLKTAVGKQTFEALQEIKLKVGPSEIKIDMSGVTIKGPMIKIEGMAMIEAKAPMTQVQGQGLLILKGALTMIN